MASSALRIADYDRQDTLAPSPGLNAEHRLGAAHRLQVLAGLPAGSVWQADRIAQHSGAVHRNSEARNGQIVVARVDDDVTVKTLQRKGAVVELLPANPDYAPIVIDTRRAPVVIEGVMVGLIRKDH